MVSKNSKKVLVTGASKGIGREVCQRLDEDGYLVTGVARTKPDDWPEHLPFYLVDLGNQEQLSEFIHVLKKADPFYGLVNNVGIVPVGSIEEVNNNDLQKAVQLNLAVAIAITQALLPGMRSLKLGRILNISSRAALGKENRTVYSLSKAGMIGMTRTWALELGRDSITVNAIAPGPIATDFFHSVNNEEDEATQKLISGIPIGRIGMPEDVAHAVAYFLDERCGYVTGQTHYVCGGITVGAA